jgi:hypothetical protein
MRSVHCHAWGEEVLHVDDADGPAVLINYRDLIDAVFGYEGTGLANRGGAFNGERATGHDFADGAIQPSRVVKDKSPEVAVCKEPRDAAVTIQYQYSASMTHRASVIVRRAFQRFANRLICCSRREIRAGTKANQLVDRSKHCAQRATWVAGSEIRG